jgi:hypothetical protein
MNKTNNFIIFLYDKLIEWYINLLFIYDTLQMAGQAPVKEMENMKVSEKKEENGSEKKAEATVDTAKLKEQFKAFSKFGDVKSDGKLITLSQSDKWMKQAGVIDKKITTTDTGIHFKKLKSIKVGYADYSKFLEDLAKTRGVESSELKNKLANCGAPGSNSKVAVSICIQK